MSGHQKCSNLRLWQTDLGILFLPPASLDADGVTLDKSQVQRRTPHRKALTLQIPTPPLKKFSFSLISLEPLWNITPALSWKHFCGIITLVYLVYRSLLCSSAMTASHPLVVTIVIAAESFTDMNKWVFDFKYGNTTFLLSRVRMKEQEMLSNLMSVQIISPEFWLSPHTICSSSTLVMVLVLCRTVKAMTRCRGWWWRWWWWRLLQR